MSCLHETHLPEVNYHFYVLRYIFYCEMTFTSHKRVSCKHGIREEPQSAISEGRVKW